MFKTIKSLLKSIGRRTVKVLSDYLPEYKTDGAACFDLASIVKKAQTMDESKFADWRSEKYGKTDFDRLRYFLCGAYLCCKDIDSTNWFEHWPDDIRIYVAQAYSMIQAWNRANKLNKINPEPEEIAANERQMDVSAVNKLGWRFLLQELQKEETNGIRRTQ